MKPQEYINGKTHNANIVIFIVISVHQHELHIFVLF